jgi:hypothetical protein
MAWPTTVPTFTAATELEAADLNDLRDALKAIGDAWTTYTPSWTAATTSPTVGSSSVTGCYRKMGHTADVRINISVGAGFSAGSGTYRFSLPSGVVATVVHSGEAMGVATVFDSSAGATYKSVAYMYSSTAVSLIGDAAVVGSASPITWASGDRISILIPSLEID